MSMTMDHSEFDARDYAQRLYKTIDGKVSNMARSQMDLLNKAMQMLSVDNGSTMVDIGTG